MDMSCTKYVQIMYKGCTAPGNYIKKGEEKMKKRIISVLLCAGLVASMLAGCGSKEEPAAAEPAAEEEAEEPAAEEAEEPAAAADVADLKFGFVVGSFEHTFYQLIGEGIEAECEAKGVGSYSVLDASLDPVIATQKVETLTADGCNAALWTDRKANCCGKTVGKKF